MPATSPGISPETAASAPVAHSITLPVLGMSCAACQAHVERVLRESPGVEEAAVNLMTHTARVRLRPSGSVAALVDAIREAGYESELPARQGSDDAAGAGKGARDGKDRESHLRARAFFALGAGALLMVMSMARPVPIVRFSMMALTLFGMVWAGGPIYRRAWLAACHGTSNMHTLVALGTLAAFASSAAATLAPGLLIAHGLRPALYYDAVLLILGFLLLGSWLDARAKRRTLDAVRSFAALQPETAVILRDGEETRVAAGLVVSDDVVIVRPGERLPVDGAVLEGSSSIDESLVTGESTPVLRTVGDRVIGGSLNYDGRLRYRATSVGATSMLGQMLALMESAQASKAPMQQLADRVSGIFVPIVLGIAALTLTVWLLATHDPGRSLAVSIAVLVIACPCAMGLAVPAALTVAIGRASQLGVLFKSGEALERLAGVDTVVFDKTGTLTEGKPRITRVLTVEQDSLENGIGPGLGLLEVAAALEQGSEHPLAEAVLSYAFERGVHEPPASETRAVPGRGLVGVVRGQAAAAGNAALMAELGVPLPATLELGESGTLLHISRSGCYLGTIVAADVLRPGAPAAVTALHRMGLRTVMLTGDNNAEAAGVAAASGLQSFEADLLPGDKLARIRSLQAAGQRVAMVGDGINDAAALAQADAGLAVGTGTDLAREAGDAILLRGDPSEVVKAIAMARHTRRAMRQNLVWALGYNLLGIPLAAGVLYPATGLLLSPVVASAAMALSSASVLANSLRLRHYTPR